MTVVINLSRPDEDSAEFIRDCEERAAAGETIKENWTACRHGLHEFYLTDEPRGSKLLRTHVYQLPHDLPYNRYSVVVYAPERCVGPFTTEMGALIGAEKLLAASLPATVVARIARLEDELVKLGGRVDTLAKTEDGVTIFPGLLLWMRVGEKWTMVRTHRVGADSLTVIVPTNNSQYMTDVLPAQVKRVHPEDKTTPEEAWERDLRAVSKQTTKDNC